MARYVKKIYYTCIIINVINLVNNDTSERISYEANIAIGAKMCL